MDVNMWGAAGDRLALGTAMLYSPLSLLAFLSSHIWPGPLSEVTWEHVSFEVRATAANCCPLLFFCAWPPCGHGGVSCFSVTSILQHFHQGQPILPRAQPVS